MWVCVWQLCVNVCVCVWDCSVHQNKNQLQKHTWLIMNIFGIFFLYFLWVTKTMMTVKLDKIPKIPSVTCIITTVLYAWEALEWATSETLRAVAGCSVFVSLACDVDVVFSMSYNCANTQMDVVALLHIFVAFLSISLLCCEWDKSTGVINTANAQRQILRRSKVLHQQLFHKNCSFCMFCWSFCGFCCVVQRCGQIGFIDCGIIFDSRHHNFCIGSLLQELHSSTSQSPIT